jgi:hypothetical protein
MDTQRTFTDAQMRCIDEHRDINTAHEWWDCTYEMFCEDMKFAGIPVETNRRTFTKRDGTKGHVDEPVIYFDTYPKAAWFSTQVVVLGDLARSALEIEEIEAHWLNETEGHETLEGWRKEICDFLTGFINTFQKYQLLAEVMDELDNMQFRMVVDENRRRNMRVEVEECGHSLEEECPQFDADCEGLDDWIQKCFHDIAYELARVLEDEVDYLQGDEAVWDTIEANDLFEDDEDDGGE